MASKIEQIYRRWKHWDLTVLLTILIFIVALTDWSSVCTNMAADRVIRIYLVCTDKTRIVEDAREASSGKRSDKVYIVQYYRSTRNHGLWHEYYRTRDEIGAYDACHNRENYMEINDSVD